MVMVFEKDLFSGYYSMHWVKEVKRGRRLNALAVVNYCIQKGGPGFWHGLLLLLAAFWKV
jgi:hypothetical protein